jgi:hypothetical protein
MSNNKVKIIEPIWHEPQIEQVIGRAIRYSSHSSPTDITNNDEKINDNKKKISELRNELVDYSDITPNEPRYIKENVLSNEMFYPFGNIRYLVCFTLLVSLFRVRSVYLYYLQ